MGWTTKQAPMCCPKVAAMAVAAVPERHGRSMGGSQVHAGWPVNGGGNPWIFWGETKLGKSIDFFWGGEPNDSKMYRFLGGETIIGEMYHVSYHLFWGNYRIGNVSVFGGEISRVTAIFSGIKHDKTKKIVYPLVIEQFVHPRERARNRTCL